MTTAYRWDYKEAITVATHFLEQLFTSHYGSQRKGDSQQLHVLFCPSLSVLPPFKTRALFGVVLGLPFWLLFCFPHFATRCVDLQSIFPNSAINQL
jgi:hypothetical protein